MSPGIDQDKIWRLLEGCLVQASASNEWLERRILPLSVGQLRWRQSFTRWSIAACLDHLNRTFDYYLSKIEEAFDKGRNGEPFRFLESEDEFLRQMEPPIVATIKGPALLLPAPAIYGRVRMTVRMPPAQDITVIGHPGQIARISLPRNSERLT